jgi:hypothetical protein
MQPNGDAEEFYKYTEGIRKKFPGYELDDNNLVYNVSDKEIDFNDHWKLLLTDYEETFYN